MSDSDVPPRRHLRQDTARQIRIYLAERNMSQAELARRMGMKQQVLSRRMTGETAFDLDDLGAIADVLGVPVNSLLPSRDVVNTVRDFGQTESASSAPVSTGRPPRNAKRHRPRPGGMTPKSATRRPSMLHRPAVA